MHPYPHLYQAAAVGGQAGLIDVSSARVASFTSAAPLEFDGPGDQWSPEALLVAAVADCLILTFRAVARAAKFEWSQLECRTEGRLERVEGVSKFTEYTTHATLRVPAGTDTARAEQLLEKAEKGCLIANSLTGVRRLEARIVSA